MSGEGQPVCWIIAGPNGAGKTTFALKYLPEAANCDRFVNADLIAAGMSPLYLALPNVEMSKLRVAERVAHGGHDIPAIAIDRRFARSLRNLFRHYAPAADRTHCYINSETIPVLVFVQRYDERRIIDHDMVAHLEREAGL